MIDAADSAFLVASEEERGAAMRAAVVHHADPAGAVAKRDQLLAKQHQPDRRAVALELRGLRGRNPVLPHQLAHHRSGTDLREFLSFRGTCHRTLPMRRCAAHLRCGGAPLFDRILSRTAVAWWP